MTHDKAREYFSAYLEGTLEPGLTSSLERKFNADASLRAEYDAFSETIGALQILRAESIEIPAYLSDRIANRIDSVRETASEPFWVTWFKPKTSVASGPRYVWALGAAACLLAASVSLRGMRGDGTANASLAPSDSGEAVTWTQEDAGLLAKFAAGAARTVQVLPQAGATQNYQVGARQGLELTLSNPNTGARRFTLLNGNDLIATVVVPGQKPSVRKPGSGTITELASALADAYRVPVVIKGSGLGPTVRWNFESTNVRTAAEQGLDGQGNATMMNGNVLQIGR